MKRYYVHQEHKLRATRWHRRKMRQYRALQLKLGVYPNGLGGAIGRLAAAHFDIPYNRWHA